MKTKLDAWYAPIFELSRGGVLESLHHGAVAVVDAAGNILASYGDPSAVTYVRSTAKPFQVLPLLEHGGRDFFSLSNCEVALMCASHSGTDMHMAVLQALQEKVGVLEADLLCGIHYPSDKLTAEKMRREGISPTPNRHNCSGKHTGMLAFERMIQAKGQYLPPGLQYIDPQHPIQLEIFQTFADMCAITPGEIVIGIDGCSAPNFALPIYNVALAYSRLATFEHGDITLDRRQKACQVVTGAMVSNPVLVAGPGKFDTCIMEVSQGRILAKGGAEGYQGVVVMPGVLAPRSPAVGIVVKIADGDRRQKIRSAVVLEVLHQLGVLNKEELAALETFGPSFPVLNWRGIHVGEGHPCFILN